MSSTAIASFDSLFSIPDFRIREKIFRLILQTKDIAREKFLIQTRNPNDSTVEFAISGNLVEFYKKEMGEIKSSHYFSNNDGIYIKKNNINNNYQNNNNYKTVKLIGNFWDSEEQLTNEFNLMCPKKDYFYNHE